jgi:chitin synthase
MAYRQPQHDPYYGQQQQQPYQHSNNLVPDVLPTQHYGQPAGGYNNHNEYDGQWDAKSTHTYESQYNGSQVHLNPQGYGQQHDAGYEMSQVTLTNGVPPSTSPYGQQQQYPPQQQSQQQQSYQQQQQQQQQPQQRAVQFRPGMPAREQSAGGYSAAKEKMLRRRSVRQVELQQGNLVLDMPVPQSIVPAGAKAEEQTTLRYTAATCDPDEFMRSKYTLRPYLYGRQTELFIVMTM